LLVANEALSQLSYSPTSSKSILAKQKSVANTRSGECKRENARREIRNSQFVIRSSSRGNAQTTKERCGNKRIDNKFRRTDCPRFAFLGFVLTADRPTHPSVAPRSSEHFGKGRAPAEWPLRPSAPEG